MKKMSGSCVACGSAFGIGYASPKGDTLYFGILSEDSIDAIEYFSFAVCPQLSEGLFDFYCFDCFKQSLDEPDILLSRLLDLMSELNNAASSISQSLLTNDKDMKK